MTKTELRRRVIFWQRRLAGLGVGHWRVEEVELSDEPVGKASSLAGVTLAGSYDSVWFQVKPELLDASQREVDEVIVHEWLHVAMRDFDGVIDAGEGLVGELWADLIDHEREGLVERLARVIVSEVVHSRR